MTQKGKPPKYYLGVDPGKNGGLCVLRSDGEPMEYDRMPNGKARIADWISRGATHRRVGTAEESVTNQPSKLQGEIR